MFGDASDNDLVNGCFGGRDALPFLELSCGDWGTKLLVAAGGEQGSEKQRRRARSKARPDEVEGREGAMGAVVVVSGGSRNSFLGFFVTWSKVLISGELRLLEEEAPEHPQVEQGVW